MREAAAGNLLAILPEDLQMDIVATALARYLKTATKPALVVVPSRKDASYIREFLMRETGYYTIGVATGSISRKKREKIWGGLDIVCTTAEMFVKDVDREIVFPDQFGLAVFVRARQAVGRHAYAETARRLTGSARILGVTDTLPSRSDRCVEMVRALGTTLVGGWPERSPDGPARRGRTVECIRVDLQPEIAAIRDFLGRALHDACTPLRESGYGELEDPPLSRLIGMSDAAGNAGAPPDDARSAIIARCALDALEAYGPAPFLNFCEWCRGRPGIGAPLGRPQFDKAVDAAWRVLSGGQDHPKMNKLAGMLAAPVRALVAAGPDGSVPDILQCLAEAGIPAARLPPDARTAGPARMERAVAVNGLRGGRYRVLVSQHAKDAYDCIAGGRLVPGDIDMVACCAGGAVEARYALGCGAARTVALVTGGSAEDPDRWAADQMDWKTRMVIEENRRRAAPEECAAGRGGAGLAARDDDRPEYELRRRHGEDMVLGPAGAGGTFVVAVDDRGRKVRALLGRAVSRSGGLTYYMVWDSRPAGGKSRGDATPGQKAAPYAQLAKLASHGRNVADAPIEKWREILGGRISVEDYNALMRALGRALRASIPPKDQLRNRLRRMIHVAIMGLDGGRMSLYATAEGRLYNGPAGGSLKEGHRKILDYKLKREIRGGRNIRAICEYVNPLADRLMAETGNRPEFAE